MGEDRTGATGADRRRLTVPEAAEVLGITVDAVRGRIRRGKLEAEHDQGAVYVWIEVPEEADSRRPSPASQRPSSDQSELVEALREQVAYLRGVIATRDQELALRAEEIRRRDAALEREQQLTAIFADRLRELEAPERPSEARETPVSPGPSDTPTAPTGGQEAATERAEGDVQRRSWWRRVFGG